MKTSFSIFLNCTTSIHNNYLPILTQMTINHDKKLTSFFNMPVKEVTGMRGKPDRVSSQSRSQFASWPIPAQVPQLTQKSGSGTLTS